MNPSCIDRSSVVQRQLWLRHNVPGITAAEAYDIARKEFYDLRLQEDVERRVAKEEAMAIGAYFGPSALDIGLELETQEYERWRDWAQKEVELVKQKQAAMYTGGVESEDAVLDADTGAGEVDAGLEEVSDAIPAQRKSAQGGAMFTP